ncbi:MAG: molybdopterin-binding protein, partial [Pseudomonadota bacterium]
AANAAVDGYGINGSAHEPQLVSGRAAAGHPFDGPVSDGQAVRILTGASVPPGVDRIALQEEVTVTATHVHLPGTLKQGANIRAAGEDIAAGAIVFAQGHRLRPVDLGVLASVGVGQVQVYERLTVAVLSTGDELQPPGAPAHDYQIYDANRPMLLAQVAAWGFDVVDVGIIPDDRASVRAALNQAARADIILTSGGASAGDEDHIAALLNETGSMALWRIAIKPGRPLGLGVWNGTPVFALPGNPVAAFVCTFLFGQPAMNVLAGAGFSTPKRLTLPAAFAKRKKPGRREYLRARVTADGVETFGSEGSGRISGLSWAEGLVELPDHAVTIAPGDRVTFIPFVQ